MAFIGDAISLHFLMLLLAVAMTCCAALCLKARLWSTSARVTEVGVQTINFNITGYDWTVATLPEEIELTRQGTHYHTSRDCPGLNNARAWMPSRKRCAFCSAHYRQRLG